ncbi:MAG: hypothetical protein MMC33_009650 [Icmadophila ericetorum]|nr:hypothetical protein [Icmadophila ericetorum]
MVVSLYQLARNSCIKNIRSITDVGDVPYKLLRPVLLKLENPEQLYELEQNSPQIIGHDEELWRAFIKRDVENWEEKMIEPKNPQSWYKVYRKLQKENARRVDEDAAILEAAMAGIKAEQAKRTTKVLDAGVLPRLPAKGQRRRGLGGPIRDHSVLSFASGSKTKVLTGKGVIDKARREARELSLLNSKRSALATPTHKLANYATHIRNAPEGLMDAHRRQASAYIDPKPKQATTVFAPKKHIPTPRPTGMTTEEREKRLREISNGASSKTASRPQTPLTPSFESGSPNDFRAPASDGDEAGKKFRSPAHRGSPGLGNQPRMKAKAPVDPFMPQKKRQRVL